MGNYIEKYSNPSDALKKLYKFNNENIDLLKENIFIELDTNINYDLYKSYDKYINSILNFQNHLSSKVSKGNKIKLENINKFCFDIKNKYKENYDKYNNQNKRREDYKQNISNFSFNNDSYKIFNLNKDFTMDELKIAYRNMARIYHPDRPDGDNNKFKHITKAYLSLMEELKKKEETKPFYELKQDSLNYFTNNSNNINTNSKLIGKFDNKLFNKIYEENKLYDVNDTGYRNWLKEDSKDKIEIDNSKLFSKNFNVNVFNNIFDKKVERDNKLVKFNIPKEANSFDNHLLGETNIESYTGGLYSNLYDIKDAFTLSNIGDINKNTNNIKKDDIEKIKKERLKNRFFTDEDSDNYHRFINYNLTEEERRLEGLKKIDQQIEDNYKKTNKKMITSMFIKK